MTEQPTSPPKRTFAPVSFEPVPSEGADKHNWAATETQFYPFWTKQSLWFSVPPNLRTKMLSLRMVRKSNTDARYFFLLPEGDSNEVKQSDIGAKYDLYAIPVIVFPLLPNADSKSAGFIVGLRHLVETNAATELRLRDFHRDFDVAMNLADQLQKPLSVRIIHVQSPLFPEKKITHLAGGDFRVEDIYPPTSADADRIPVNETKARFIAEMGQDEFYDFLMSTGYLVEKVDRILKAVERVCNASARS